MAKLVMTQEEFEFCYEYNKQVVRLFGVGGTSIESDVRYKQLKAKYEGLKINQRRKFMLAIK